MPASLNLQRLETPVRPFDGFITHRIQLSKQGQGWYFSHGGGNWGFRCFLWAHKVKGYGFAIMTNAENGGIITDEIKASIERVYGYDSLDKAVLR